MKMTRSKKKSSKGGGKSSFMLMIGDEGSIMLHLQNKAVVKRIFASTPDREHTRAMDEMLNAHPNAPITMLVDMMDQSYVRQTLPPVSSLNVGKIIRRRLNKDFSNDDIKGYLIFGRDKKGRKDWNYLMASLANPPLLQKWSDFTVERRNPFKGLALVPLECQPLIKALEAAELAGKEKDAKPTEWHILISHHKVGGFRQIVIKNGQLVFTRLAQLVGEPTPEVIAGNIEQEMLNTLEYLKRLGLTDNAAISASIIASSDIKAAFDHKTIRVGQCNFYTPFEMAGLLGMEEIAKPEDHFGDVVIAGFIARRRKLLLSLFTSYTNRIAKLMRYRMFAKTAAALSCVAILGWMGFSANDYFTAQSAMEDIETKLTQLTGQYNAEDAKKKELPQKITNYVDIANLFTNFYQPTYDPSFFARTLGNALGGLTIVKSYHWSLTSGLSNAQNEDKRQVGVEIETTLTTPQEPRDTFVANAQKLVDNVKKTFANYEVTNSDLPGILSESKELKTVVSDAGGDTTQSETLNSSMKFTFKGPVTDKTLKGTMSPGGRPMPTPGGP